MASNSVAANLLMFGIVAAGLVAWTGLEQEAWPTVPFNQFEIEAAVGRIQTFPGGAERPQIREMTNAHSMIRLIVYGDVPERSLKELAHRIEDDLAALPSVSQVETSGVRNYKISIEVPLRRLRSLGLTLTDLATAIRRSSLDLSAGSIDSAWAISPRCATVSRTSI